MTGAWMCQHVAGQGYGCDSRAVLQVGTDTADYSCVKTAFSVWEQRIAPVFDTAKQLYLVESENGLVTAEAAYLVDVDLTRRLAWLTARGVQTLVCGAVSRPLQERLAAAGIQVVPFVAGELRAVIRASLDGTLCGAAFAMPGCCNQRRRRRQGSGRCCGSL